MNITFVTEFPAEHLEGWRKQDSLPDPHHLDPKCPLQASVALTSRSADEIFLYSLTVSRKRSLGRKRQDRTPTRNNSATSSDL